MYLWFYGYINLITLIDFQNLDVSDCTNFSGMFYNCQSLINISVLENWNFSNGEYFQDMFENCISLKKFHYQI